MSNKVRCYTRAQFAPDDVKLETPLAVYVSFWDMNSGAEVVIVLSVDDAVKLGHQIQVSALNGFQQIKDYSGLETKEKTS